MSDQISEQIGAEKNMSEWKPISELPDFNGKVRYEDNGVKERECWYETGDRRFPQGFSLLPPHLIPKIIEWRKL